MSPDDFDKRLCRTFGLSAVQSEPLLSPAIYMPSHKTSATLKTSIELVGAPTLPGFVTVVPAFCAIFAGQKRALAYSLRGRWGLSTLFSFPVFSPTITTLRVNASSSYTARCTSSPYVEAAWEQFPTVVVKTCVNLYRGILFSWNFA